MHAAATRLKTRTIADLLAAESATVKKTAVFRNLVLTFDSDTRLARVRLNGLAWRLLHDPRLKPEYLANFYRTYRIPAHPFFPLYLSMKWAQVRDRKRRVESRTARIDAIRAGYPPGISEMFEYLRKTECRFARSTPVWNAVFSVRTLKKAGELSRFTLADWLAFFSGGIEILSRTYPVPLFRKGEVLGAMMILGCLPPPGSARLPDEAAVRKGFRRASGAFHPDKGGTAEDFILVKRAMDALHAERALLVKQARGG